MNNENVAMEIVPKKSSEFINDLALPIQFKLPSKLSRVYLQIPNQSEGNSN